MAIEATIPRNAQSQRNGNVGVPNRFNLTPRQYDLLTFLRSYVAQHGYGPSFDEMAAGLGLASKSGIDRLITGLEERGHVRRIPYLARSLTLVGEGSTG